MSDEHDHDYPRGTVQVDETCETCGGLFRATAREAGTDGSGRPVLQLESRDCPACVELGAKPPECLALGCGGELRGMVDYTRRVGSVCYECRKCDQQFSIDTLRAPRLREDRQKP